jgi:predicted O-methyltransferase YrrM
MRALIRSVTPGFVLRTKRAIQREIELSRSIAGVAKLGEARDPAEALEMVQGFRGWGDYARIDSVQIPSEICALFDLLREQKVRRACEIGSFLGGTLCMMTRLLPDDAELFSLDWPEVADGPRPLATRKRFHEGFARKDQRVTVLYGDSHSEETAGRLATLLEGRPLDFLFIDGDHSSEGVRQDFELYAPFVRAGGLIGFHDIVPHDEAGFGVAEFWEELRTRYETREICDLEARERRAGFGIGVLTWPGV